MRKSFLIFLVAAGSAAVAPGQIVPASAGRIVNFSVRAYSGAGDNVLISGFVLGGRSTRPLLVRAIGPGLAAFGVSNYMLDPELRIFRTPLQEMTNDNWSGVIDLTDTYRRLGAFDLRHDSADAAVLLPLAPGAYTAHARGRNQTTGEVLLEFYDAGDAGDLSQSVANVSLRGQLGAATPLLIGGFVISDGAPKRVLVRAIGPTLAAFGVGGALGNPRIRLYRGSTNIAENDDWAGAGTDPTASEQAFAAAGAFALPRGSRDAVLVLALEPGAYTAHVDDPTGGSGVVLTEIYDLEPPAPGGIAPNPPPGAGALPPVSILANHGRIREGATPGGSVLVIRGGDVSAPLRVFLSKSGTITNEDISGVPASVLIAAGSSTVSVPVSAWSDGQWEPSEILTIALDTNPAYLVSGLGRAHVVIADATQTSGTGWKGEYFNNISVTGTPVLTRADATIDFNWQSAAPGASVNADGFSVRWTGYLEVNATGNHTFTTRTDDGTRLWINNQLVIDRWVDQSVTERSATVSLTAGVRYPIRMEYYDRANGAIAVLYWLQPGKTREVVPATNVFQAESSAPVITSEVEALALAGGPFSYTINAVGGASSFSVIDLPPGLSFNAATGTISGTPTTAGEFSVVLQATNTHGTGAEVLKLNVVSAGPAPEAERWSTASAGLEAPMAPPTSTQVLTSFASAAPGGTALERVRGFFLAPESGNYQFAIAASGPARLMFADSDQPADRWERARVATSSPAQQWTATAEQSALPIVLEAGKRYYFEATHRPAGGAHLSVAWRRPSAAANAALEVVPAYTLSKYVDRPATDDGKTLYLGSLRTMSGVISPASGLVSLLFDENTRTASITLRMTGLSSTQISAYILAGPEGQTGPLIQPLPNGQFNNFVWQMRDTGNLTVADLVDALRDGLLYVVVYSSNYPEGELRGAFGPAEGSSAFVPPLAPPALSLASPTSSDAARFLTQATFGPTTDEIDRVVRNGYQAWLNTQFGRAVNDHMQYLDAIAAEYALRDPPQTINAGNRQEGWWQRTLRSEDQLRQRVAFALSEILVVSDIGVLNGQTVGVATYYDILVAHAFGNFRDLLEAVTLSPAMGNYLSMLRNQKADPARGTLPDENYAREIMQLFTIGLNKLHPDGTLMLDSNGVPIPTYTQDNILGFARVFTGWSYHAAAGEENFRFGARDFRNPMMLYPEYHEMGDKLLLESSVLPGGQTGAAEMDFVLDLLVNHPNTGPFICRQLIQRLVTSNPSPGYVYRVAQVFANNGSGVRGDLRAVVQAILLDYEARSPAVTTTVGYGKLREPLLRMSHLWRAFNAAATAGFPYSYRNPERDLIQAALRAPTVFNFFEPGHVHPGLLASAGLLAPEFQITNEQSLVSTTNALRRAVFRGLGSSEYPILLDLRAATPLANDPARLLDWMNLVLMNGQMSATMRTTLTQALAGMPEADATEKVQSVINLITTSAEYAVQR